MVGDWGIMVSDGRCGALWLMTGALWLMAGALWLVTEALYCAIIGDGGVIQSTPS